MILVGRVDYPLQRYSPNKAVTITKSMQLLLQQTQSHMSMLNGVRDGSFSLVTALRETNNGKETQENHKSKHLQSITHSIPTKNESR